MKGIMQREGLSDGIVTGMGTTAPQTNDLQTHHIIYCHFPVTFLHEEKKLYGAGGSVFGIQLKAPARS